MPAYKNTMSSLSSNSQNHQHNAPSITALLFVALLLFASLLFGCGGGVSTASQPVSANPGTGSGTGTSYGSASLSWTAPTTNIDGTPLSDLAGYKVYYGTTPGVYTSIIVGNRTTHQVDGLTKGQTYYFTVTAYDTKGNESDYAPVVSKLII